MAECSISVAQDQFSCSICLDLLKDPVAIPCGHSYCMSCISDCWDQDEQRGVYSCPQCRQTFTPRPALGKNTMLAEVVGKLKKTKLQAARPAQCYSESADVECDVCTGDKNKAVKSCLMCLNSYCQNHLEQHASFFRSKKHNLMDATGRLQEMICPQHDKLLEVFCRTDQCCICYLCTMDGHKNHNTVSAAAERTDKHRQLEETQSKLHQRIQRKQVEFEELRAAVESHKCSAQAAVEDTERIFTDLIRSIERSRSEVTQLIRDQEKAAVSEAEGRLERLEQEIDDLRRRDAELEQLSHTDHHIHFLQSFQSLSTPPGSTDSSSITVSSSLSFDDVGKSVSRLREKLEHFCREEIEKITWRMRDYKGTTPTPEPKTHQEFLQYTCWLFLDLNTMNKNLVLSKGNRVIELSSTVQQYPDHPDRFDCWHQVLCRESVCGRCYWEVEWSGSVGISVAYKSIGWKGQGTEFGYSNQSWCLFCSGSICTFVHKSKHTVLPLVSSSSRIGVYVDHSAGTLSFYSVSDTMSLIHRVHTTFTQPLYPGFELVSYNPCGSKLKLCEL
ncbi:E3 ubiquitin/ISG15 ligase TRIM25 [Danio rerio]|uniref:E3 ubiquitin/ISG15 ligase TRIM25 n=1 Tax=Danio rerio TaxID=7955 RepID=A0A8N7UVE5_DANRE|nr:tripartite motif-containing protein 16-like [Danio rerio]|eukprot:XP_700123.5 tripartite motif-containing protein 16-like [Danio rerio]